MAIPNFTENATWYLKDKINKEHLHWVDRFSGINLPEYTCTSAVAKPLDSKAIETLINDIKDRSGQPFKPKPTSPWGFGSFDLTIDKDMFKDDLYAPIAKQYLFGGSGCKLLKKEMDNFKCILAVEKIAARKGKKMKVNKIKRGTQCWVRDGETDQWQATIYESYYRDTEYSHVTRSHVTRLGRYRYVTLEFPVEQAIEDIHKLIKTRTFSPEGSDDNIRRFYREKLERQELNIKNLYERLYKLENTPVASEEIEQLKVEVDLLKYPMGRIERIGWVKTYIYANKSYEFELEHKEQIIGYRKQGDYVELECIVEEVEVDPLTRKPTSEMTTSVINKIFILYDGKMVPLNDCKVVFAEIFIEVKGA
jgi:hypothetical protein